MITSLGKDPAVQEPQKANILSSHSKNYLYSHFPLVALERTLVSGQSSPRVSQIILHIRPRNRSGQWSCSYETRQADMYIRIVIDNMNYCGSSCYLWYCI